MNRGNYVSTKDIHGCERTVRLTESRDQLLQRLAAELDIAPAVLIRIWAHKGMDETLRRREAQGRIEITDI